MAFQMLLSERDVPFDEKEKKPSLICTRFGERLIANASKRRLFMLMIEKAATEQIRKHCCCSCR